MNKKTVTESDDRPEDHVLAMAYELEKSSELNLSWEQSVIAARICDLVLAGRWMI